MSFDTTSLSIADNSNNKALNNTNDDHVLRFHDDAYKGLMRSEKAPNSSTMQDIIDYFRPAPKGFGEGGQGQDKPVEIISVKNAEPTDKERAEAEKKIEKGMSKLIPEADRAVMKEMTTALTNGDAKAFGEALKKVGNDPEKLKAMLDDINKVLEAKGSNTKLDVTSEGKVLVSDGNNRTAVAFNPENGKTEVKRVEHGFDGSVTVLPGEVLHVSAADTFTDIGNSAVEGVNRGPGFNLPKIVGFDDPIFKPERPVWGGPIKPIEEPIKPWQEPFRPWNEPIKPSTYEPFKPWMLETYKKGYDLDMQMLIQK